jgi:hypothetical protein
MKEILRELNIPLKKEYKAQKTKIADKWCLHLKGIKYVDINQGDQIISVPMCEKCKKLLDETEIKFRELKLKNFKK